MSVLLERSYKAYFPLGVRLFYGRFVFFDNISFVSLSNADMKVLGMWWLGESFQLYFLSTTFG